MCFPLGVVTAFYGLARAMNLLHGSQGCGTYIRRHMATHYNEPIDIATSSLSEEGAVFGGEKNLHKGLRNLIKLYDPEIIGVSTTCLAETIGEDLPGSLKRFRDSNPGLKARLIPVNAPGYGGTHFEGYWRGLKAILAGLDLDPTPHGGVNVIAGPISPADARHLRDVLAAALPGHTLFPDISDNLDGAFNPVYDRLPRKGTTVSRIVRMAGASATLELSLFAPPEDSPGAYLEKAYGVRLLRLAPPVGLSLTDAFMTALAELGGVIPARALEERGRLMDAMADSHKYSALGRAAIFGDPDFVHSMACLAAENGLSTALAATGSKSAAFRAVTKKALGPAFGIGQEPVVADSADFALIESLCRKTGANLLVGSSEGRRLAQRENIPLVRCAFPCHDHVGGQRVRTMGYGGSTALLDRMVNELISAEEESFRGELKATHFRPRSADGADDGLRVPTTGDDQAGPSERWITTSPTFTGSEPDLAPWGLPGAAGRAAAGLTDDHPCFGLKAAHGRSRLHLPIAPGCNVSCNYCRRDMDCPNESRPGASSALLGPAEALERFREAKRTLPNLGVVGFAGPGESLNRPETLFETMELIRREDKDVALCLSTNGLALPFHVAELRRLGLSHLTVTVNADKPATAAKIYAWADHFGQRYRGREAAELILNNQMAGIRAAKALGLAVKVNTVLIGGVNEGEVLAIAKKMAAAGVDIGNVMPHIPIAGTAFGHLKAPGAAKIRDLRFACGAHLPQMTHCRQCRADAAGPLGQDQRFWAQSEAPPPPVAPGDGAFKVAVISKSGVMVDSHFGQAERVYVFESDGRSTRLLEIRKVGERSGPCSCGRGPGARKTDKTQGFIERLVQSLLDVDAVVALRIGDSPKTIFKKYGIRCYTAMDSLENAAKAAASSLVEANSGHEGPDLPQSLALA
jgi:nitrogenase molybdenum-iron protein alpha/beta subunit/MoaA/NifB/PqqE/SkfB family radical SAM enzyme